MRICFLTVKDNPTKLQKICEIIGSHFVKKQRVLIAVPSNEAAAYIDQLLWKMPEEGFIPHAIHQNATQDYVVITTAPQNLNQAQVIVNLLPTQHPNPGSVDTIYELMDLTSRDKEETSRKKQATYQQAGYFVEEL